MRWKVMFGPLPISLNRIEKVLSISEIYGVVLTPTPSTWATTYGSCLGNGGLSYANCRVDMYPFWTSVDEMLVYRLSSSLSP